MTKRKYQEPIDLNPEHWKPTYILPELYRISDDGRIYSIKYRKILKSYMGTSGYLFFSMRCMGVKKNVYLHRLVALAFIPNPENKPEIDHINGIRTDNRVENLRWVSSKENKNNVNTYPRLLRHTLEMVEQSKKPVVLYKDGVFVGEFESQKAISRFLGVSPSTIRYYMNGEGKQYKGYTFKRRMTNGYSADT